MSTRLNADIRAQITQNMWLAQFKPKWEAHREREYALARRVYLEVLSDKQRELQDQMRALNNDFFPFQPRIHVITHLGYSQVLETANDVTSFGTTSHTGSYRLHGDKFRKLSEAVMACVEAKETLRQDEKKAREALYKALTRVTTLEKLFTAWPEGKAFYSAPPLEKPLAVPTIRFHDVNQMIGL